MMHHPEQRQRGDEPERRAQQQRLVADAVATTLRVCADAWRIEIFGA
jgi:hypothetical protein